MRRFDRQIAQTSHHGPIRTTFTSQQISDAKETSGAADTDRAPGGRAEYHQANPGTRRPDRRFGRWQPTPAWRCIAAGDSPAEASTAEPATPAELRDAVRSLANALQELAVNYLAGAPTPW